MGKLLLRLSVHKCYGASPDAQDPLCRDRGTGCLVLTVETKADKDDLCQQEHQGEETHAEGYPAPGQAHSLLRS